MTQKTRVLLLGASGLTGQHCLQRLLADERVGKLTVLLRRPQPIEHAKLEQRLFEETFAEQADSFAAERVICCLGTTLKKAGSKSAFRRVDYDLCLEAAQLAAQQGAEVFTLISAVNANARGLSFYARTKGELEQALRRLPLKRLVIAQPSLLLGSRDEARFFEGMGQALAQPLVPLLRRVSPANTPISAEQLARALVNVSLQPPEEGVLVLRYPQLVAYADQPHKQKE